MTAPENSAGVGANPPASAPAGQRDAILRLCDVEAIADELGMKRKRQRPGTSRHLSGAWSLGDARLVAYDGRHDGLSVRVSQMRGPVQTRLWEARFTSGTPAALVRDTLLVAVKAPAPRSWPKSAQGASPMPDASDAGEWRGWEVYADRMGAL